MAKSWFDNIPVQVQVVLISSITSIIVVLITATLKVIYDRYSLVYKMKKEYYFVQKKKIKEQLALTKTPLIKAAEELNYRLWNLSVRIDQKRHNVDEPLWIDPERYYLRSFTYRFLAFLFWTLKAEESIYNFDLAQAEKSDTLYLKYIKTLKHFFCESLLFEDLKYSGDKATNHFYKDDLIKYTHYLENEGNCLDFKSFEDKFYADYKSITPIIKYITNVKNENDNLNYNAIRAFHLFLMLFLNKYGLDYHHTSKRKMRALIKRSYSDFGIKQGYYSFLEKNKVLPESRFIRHALSLKKPIFSNRGGALI